MKEGELQLLLGKRLCWQRTKSLYLSNYWGILVLREIKIVTDTVENIFFPVIVYRSILFVYHQNQTDY